MPSRGPAAFVQPVGHLAPAVHLESKITGEQPWPNRPSVENASRSIKRPLPPVVMAIRQPHNDKWLFSGFYPPDSPSFSFMVSSSCSVHQRPTFVCFCCPLGLSGFILKCRFLFKDFVWPWCSKSTSFFTPFPLLSAHIQPRRGSQTELSLLAFPQEDSHYLPTRSEDKSPCRLSIYLFF